MENLIKFGRFCLAIAMAVFGIQYLLYARSIAGPVPGPPWTTENVYAAYLTGLLLIIVSLSFALNKQARAAAILLGVILFLRLVFINLPPLVANIHDPGPWTSSFEVLAMCGGLLALAGTFASGPRPTSGINRAQDSLVYLGRFFFAVPLVVFGVQHFMYARFVAALVPSWIPAHLFWAYFIGGAFIVTALAIVTGKTASLAAAMLGLMFLLWVVLLHLPRVAATVRNGNEWTSAFIALAMSGSAFVLAGALATRPQYD